MDFRSKGEYFWGRYKVEKASKTVIDGIRGEK